MKLNRFITPRILIVEDQPFQAEAIQLDLEKLALESPDRKRHLGIDHFEIDVAGSVKEVDNYIKKTKGKPYDLLFLDLGIPKQKGGMQQPEFGLEVLTRMQKLRAAKETIVVSAWVTLGTQVMRHGAFDFLAKPHSTEARQARVVECWKRVLIKESTRLLGEERICDLIPFAEEGLIRPFAACFSNLIQSVISSGQDIERYVGERYALNRQEDPQDFLLTRLDLQKQSVSSARNTWGALQKDILPQHESFGAKKVKTVLEEIHLKLVPCFIIKNVSVKFHEVGEVEILSFEDNVQAILKEIIIGAVGSLPDYNETENTITVKIENGAGQIKVSFFDQLVPISSDDARIINEGLNISPVRRFGREWGLSVVQHIAMRDGGRLTIEPRTLGNIVTYFIPIAG